MGLFGEVCKCLGYLQGGKNVSKGLTKKVLKKALKKAIETIYSYALTCYTKYSFFISKYN